MDLNALKYFYAVASEKNFSQAARKLNAQQPTLSRAVQSLEDEIGTKLFERSTRTVVLTAAGQRLFGECQKVFELMNSLPQIVRQEETEFQGYMPFGISDSMCQGVLPSVIQKFKIQSPQVISSVVMGHAKHLFQKVESGDLEFALLFKDNYHGFDLEFKPFLKVPFYVAIASHTQKRPDTLRSYIAAREIEEGRIEDFKEWPLLKALVPGIRIQFSASNYILHKELVLNGSGISIFPSFLISDEIRKKQLVILNKKKPIDFTLQLVTRRQRPLTTKAIAFLELLKMQLLKEIETI